VSWPPKASTSTITSRLKSNSNDIQVVSNNKTNEQLTFQLPQVIEICMVTEDWKPLCRNVKQHYIVASCTSFSVKRYWFYHLTCNTSFCKAY
jgi:hypothetical protein